MPWTKGGRRNALAKIDLTPIRRRIVARHQWLPMKACSAEYRYRNFLDRLIDDPKNLAIGSDDADLFWQEHILQTEKYAADCRAVFGRFLHRPNRNTPVPMPPPPEDIERFRRATTPRPTRVSFIEPAPEPADDLVIVPPPIILPPRSELAEGSDSGIIPVIVAPTGDSVWDEPTRVDNRRPDWVD